jgi:hypothetical protein
MSGGPYLEHARDSAGRDAAQTIPPNRIPIVDFLDPSGGLLPCMASGVTRDPG